MIGKVTKLGKMENKIYVHPVALHTPIGTDLSSNWNSLCAGKTGIQLHEKAGVHQEDLYLSLFHIEETVNPYDQLLKKGLHDILTFHSSIDFSSERTLFIVSSTKGNIEDITQDAFASTRDIITQTTNNPNPAVILSNACISGVSAINIAANFIRANRMDHVVVIGIDIVWDFVKYGFQSLYAMSDSPVQPYDANRKGVNLGEALGAVIVSNQQINQEAAAYVSGSNSNDANHISGPSRTGEGLVRTVEQTLQRAQLTAEQIDFISGHGTGTVFNDEMESIAFSRLNMSSTPIHSLKGYYGHTLGAAGVIETIVAIQMLNKQQTISNIGFVKPGTTEPLAICQENKAFAMKRILKTASGFGGGNASLIIEKL